MKSLALSANNQATWAFLLIAAALLGFTSLSTDAYLPAMPAMANELHGDIELTVTGFLVGFMLAQLVWGPISDRVGRLRPLQIGLVLFIAGSIGCALSTSLVEIVCWRVIQAFGACTGPMIARAMVRDSFNRTGAAQVLSTLMVIMAAAPIIGPLLGGQLMLVSTWHSIFWLLAGIGAVMLCLVPLLPETLSEAAREQTPLSHSFKQYLALRQNTRFMAFMLCVTFYYVGAYAFIVGSPEVYINHYSVSPAHFGWLFAVNILGIMVMSLINKRLINVLKLESLLLGATAVASIATIALALLTYRLDLSLPVLVSLIFVFFAMNGVVAACATSAALDAVPQRAGSAAALIGALQYGSGILSSILLALCGDGTPWTMAWIMALAAIASCYCAFVGYRFSPPVELNEFHEKHS